MIVLLAVALALAGITAAANAARRASRDISCPIVPDRRKTAAQTSEWLAASVFLAAGATAGLHLGPAGATVALVLSAAATLVAVNAGRTALARRR